MLLCQGETSPDRSETGHRRNDHHVAGSASGHGRHVRRPRPPRLEADLVGVEHVGLLVHRVPRAQRPVLPMVLSGSTNLILI